VVLEEVAVLVLVVRLELLEMLDQVAVAVFWYE
jgi:hypothetical protein